MDKHTAETQVDESSEPIKRRLRRRRQTEVRIIEEVCIDGKWQSRCEGRRRFRPEHVRYSINGLYVGGKRTRKYFRSKAEAETYVQLHQVRVENLGARAKAVDGRLIEDATECDALLAPHGVRLLDVVREWIAARRELQGIPGVTVPEAAAHYGAIQRDRSQSWTVEEAVTRWIASREDMGLSQPYLAGIRWRLRHFANDFGETNLADIEARQIDAWANQKGESSQSVKHYLTVISSMFAYAVKMGRSPRNPAADVDRPKVMRDEPGILTPAQLSALLGHLSADAVPFVVLGAFAGLRPAEIGRLRWEDINFATDLVTVRPTSSKTKRRRTVPISPNLRAWLEPLAKESGKVVELGDITIRQKRLKPAREKAGLTEWPHDCLRHSAATYWLEQEADAARVALWLGHSQEVLHEHYKGLLRDPKHAAEWFAIMPATSADGGKVIRIRTA